MKKMDKIYIVGIIVMIIGVLYIGTGLFKCNKEAENRVYKQNNYQYELVQISNTKNIDGKISTGIFCGSGYINEKPYYFVYVKKENNEIQLLKLEAESYINGDYNIKIYEDSINPYIKSEYISTKQTIEIHIPPGSIIQNIDINSGNFK